VSPIGIAWPASVPAAFTESVGRALPAVLARADRSIRWIARFREYAMASTADGWQPVPIADPKADSALEDLRRAAAANGGQTMVVYQSHLIEPEAIDVVTVEFFYEDWPPAYVMIPYRNRGILRTVWYGTAVVGLSSGWARLSSS
jgi:hypothetical protein